MQTTSHILMIRPINFSFNPETAVNNAFQVPGVSEGAQEKALEEFDGLVELLTNTGIDVTVVNDSVHPFSPDSIFPNNWVSFHEPGTICLYPMFAVNRRVERKPEVLAALNKKFRLTKTNDFTHFERESLFLEGTGSMVLDRENKIAYACLSQRTDKKALDYFCHTMGYLPVSFSSTDGQGRPIYHTNVMMSVADRYVVICLDSISNAAERSALEAVIEHSGKEIIPISIDQMNHFAGNMLQLENEKGKKVMVLSKQAYDSLTTSQIQTLEGYNALAYAPLDTIETNGGGSARCMIAEVFLEKK